MISALRPFLARIKSEIVDLYRFQLHYGYLYNLAQVYSKIITSDDQNSFLKTRAGQSLQDGAKYDQPQRPVAEIVGVHPRGKSSTDWPKITLITVNSNQGSLLERCITSVVEQNYPNLEYFVIDCGSSSANVERIKRFLDSKPDIQFEWRKNCLAVDALNAALKLATGEIFNWLDPADRLEPGALLKCGQAYTAAPDAAGWVGACRYRQAAGVNAVLYPSGVESENLVHNWNGSQFAQPSCFLATAKIKQLGGFDREYSTFFGLDLWVRLLAKWHFFIGDGIWSVVEKAGGDRDLFNYRENAELERVAGKNGYTRSGATGRGYLVPLEMQKRLVSLTSGTIPRSSVDSSKKIVVISYSVPRPDKSSAEHRLDFIVRLLATNGYEINLLYSAAAPGDQKYLSARKKEINNNLLPQSATDYIDCLKKIKPDIIIISELWRISYIELIAELIEKIRAAKIECKLILDTVDFHYKEFYRKYENSGKSEDLALAEQYLALERKLYPMVDKITVVTATEKRDIEESLGKVAPIKILPNIHKIPSGLRRFAARRHICFLGNFGARHNVDAVIYFIDHIFDLILEKNPEVEFHVLGFLAEKYRPFFLHRKVKVVGFLKDINKALSYYKLFACPLTYGAGMKGKIGDAIMAGTPIVTTSIGAEGFEVINGREFFIADEPTEFAAKCCQCLNDEATWNFISYSARLMVAENYSPQIVNEKIRSILA